MYKENRLESERHRMQKAREEGRRVLRQAKEKPMILSGIKQIGTGECCKRKKQGDRRHREI